MDYTGTRDYNTYTFIWLCVPIDWARFNIIMWSPVPDDGAKGWILILQPPSQAVVKLFLRGQADTENPGIQKFRPV
jgi:hypothetical protein